MTFFLKLLYFEPLEIQFFNLLLITRTFANAFIDGATLNIDMDADFAAKELNSKIQKFKEEQIDKLIKQWMNQRAA